ncbi:MAG: hypothetical protein KJO51_04070 [Gramella sp.]|nr:hypothetical protein [Christiangramia sp.]
MRNLTLIFAFLFIGWSVSASVKSKPTTTNFYNYNDSFIFVEGGVEFAVYPNGEFDFYFNPDFRRGNSFHFSSPNVNISYNSGYNYGPYVQYDDYGAVIQIENVPVYYDYYGRIIQAGNIFLNYNNFGRLARVGNLHIHYNHAHHISHYSGYINHYNRRYVYRPWHDYYRRPHVNVSVVFGRPYRAYYEPQRISYNKYVTVYNNYYQNDRRQRTFYRPSQRVKSYNHGRRMNKKRDLAYVRNRSDYNKSATRQSVGRERSYSDSRDNIRNDRKRSESRTAVNKTPRVYSDRNERSTNSKGRSSRIDNSQNQRQISKRENSVRNPQTRSTSRIESRKSQRVEKPVSNSRQRTVKTSRSNRVESSAPATRNRTIEKRHRSSERNAVVKRPTRQRSSVKARTSAGTSRDQSVRSKKSSGSRSSARNMNNRL